MVPPRDGDPAPYSLEAHGRLVVRAIGRRTLPDFGCQKRPRCDERARPDLPGHARIYSPCRREIGLHFEMLLRPTQRAAEREVWGHI